MAISLVVYPIFRHTHDILIFIANRMYICSIIYIYTVYTQDIYIYILVNVRWWTGKPLFSFGACWSLICPRLVLRRRKNGDEMTFFCLKHAVIIAGSSQRTCTHSSYNIYHVYIIQPYFYLYEHVYIKMTMIIDDNSNSNNNKRMTLTAITHVCCFATVTHLIPFVLSHSCQSHLIPSHHDV